MRNENDLPLCPLCGYELKKNAKACPGCGSDDSTGWNDNTYLDGLDLPDSDEYEELREQEFGGSKKKGINWVTITGIIVTIVFILFFLFNLKM
jgi:hypothetical protein